MVIPTFIKFGKKENIFQDIRNRDGSNIETYKGSASSFIELENQHRVL